MFNRIQKIVCYVAMIASTLFVLPTVQAQYALTNGLLPIERDNIAIFKRISPFVVNVHNMRANVNPFFDISGAQRGVGSGFIWNNKGYIVTNYHVVHGAHRLAVTLQNGKTVQAKIVGVEPRKDIAVLKMQSTKALRGLLPMPSFPVADSAKIQVGQNAIAIGNPFGLNSTLTTGVVSAMDRAVPGVAGVTIYGMIQTDASINPGNSGGPLLDSEARLIGMNTMIYSRSGSSSGVGFAIPSNTIAHVVDQLIRYGRVTTPGFGFQPLSDQVAGQLGIRGVIIGKVVPKTPAARAGLRGVYRDNAGQLRLGDIIVAINGKRINSYDDMYHTLSKIKVGEKVTVTILRNRRERRIQLRTMNIG